jgi:integrase
VSNLPAGLRARHSRTCPIRESGRCRCQPSYEAWIFDPASNAKIRKTFRGAGARAAAAQWRIDAGHAKARGRLRAPTRRTLREEHADWLERAERGEITTRAGQPYKPSVLRGFRADFDRYVDPEIGSLRVSEVRRSDVQQLLDGLRAKNLSGSKCRNVLVGLKVLYRRVLEHDEVSMNPTTNLRLPPPAGTRERVASLTEVAELIEALPEADRCLWWCAALAGLRRGELRALRWSDIDLEANVIVVSRSWDDREGPVAPKSRKGIRRVPIPASLRKHLVAHKLRTGRDGDDLVFGIGATRPFSPAWTRRQALAAWEAANKKRAKAERPPLVPIGLHELRHSYVSMTFAAGLSLEQIGDYVGHGSTYMTDRYRHLLDGHEDEAAKRFDAYLTESTGAHTGAQGR